LEVNIAQTAFDLTKATQKYYDCMRANPYNLQREIEAYQEVNRLSEGLEYAKKVLEERF